ncbi:MAG: glycoside hydrolase family 13 protein [Spirochaetota bacterium]
MAKSEWWKHTTVYQIYPRSFQDSNGDGIGDLQGIIARLDYLHDLGVETLWLSPVYDSPNDDNGYDISDYRRIHPEFGTMDDMDALISALHAREMRLVMDLVVNHCSDEHEWFREASASRESPYHDWFMWHPGRGLSEPGSAGDPIPPRPNNWGSFFGGPAWEWNEATREYYLHLFSKKQPDFNWENPRLREAVYDMMHFWFRRGIDGFRMDVINFIGKPPGLPDADNPQGQEYVMPLARFANQPRTHEHLQEMNREVLSRYDCMTVGEMHATGLEDGVLYVDPQRKELDMIFQFEHTYLDEGPHGKYDLPRKWKLPELKEILGRWQTGLEGRGWNSLFSGNHDQPRVVSRFGNDGGASNMSGEWDDEIRYRSASALASTFYLMKGTPFIYQGEEIGMTNVSFPALDYYQDIETRNMCREATQREGADEDTLLKIVHMRSRDNARTPVQWSSETHAGFTTGVPWLSVNPNFTAINVAADRLRRYSLTAFYASLLALRREHDVFVYGTYTDIAPEHGQVYAYARGDGTEQALVVVNFSDSPSPFVIPEEYSGALSTGLLSNLGRTPEGLKSARPAGDGVGVRVELEPWEAFVSSDAGLDAGGSNSTSTTAPFGRPLWSLE